MTNQLKERPTDWSTAPCLFRIAYRCRIVTEGWELVLSMHTTLDELITMQLSLACPPSAIENLPRTLESHL